MAEGTPPQVAETLLRLTLHDPDGKWVEERGLGLLSDERPDVRGMEALCLGHVARIHRRASAQTVSQLVELLHDPDGSVVGRACDALDDVRTFGPDGSRRS